MEDKVKEVLAEHLSIDVDKVIPTADLVDDLGADSLDGIELIMKLEETFNITIPDDEADKIKTVQDAINIVSSKQ